MIRKFHDAKSEGRDEVEIWGTGSPRREFLHVEDLARAMSFTLEHDVVPAGAFVNVGAGTITCNYDGVAKHKTTIGDNASIGSNVNLVAPVEVGDGATIGAGSTISRPAPPDQLTVARAKQVTVTGWKRPVKKGN